MDDRGSGFGVFQDDDHVTTLILRTSRRRANGDMCWAGGPRRSSVGRIVPERALSTAAEPAPQ